MFQVMVALIAATSAALLTPEVQSQIITLEAPIHEAYARVENIQSQLPAATTTREKLERLLALDQAGREALQKMDFSKVPPDLMKEAGEVAFGEINAHDAADELRLRQLMPRDGWFKISECGKAATEAAFLIVQHSFDADLHRDVLRRMQALLKTKEVDGLSYGLLFDRVALEDDHHPQRYGSQVVCQGGKWAAKNLEDPGGVDARRAALGFKDTEEQYLESFRGRPCLGP